MSEREVDLYGDLTVLQNTLDNHRSLQLLEAINKENDTLKLEREELGFQLQFLRDQKKILESNLLSVFHAATNEIDRKNKMIMNLQQEVARLKASSAGRM